MLGNYEGTDARETMTGLMQGYLPKAFDALDILSYTSSTQGPTMAGAGRKFSNSRSSDAWKMLF